MHPMNNVEIGKLVAKDLEECLGRLTNDTLPRFLAAPNTALSEGVDVSINLGYRCAEDRKLVLSFSSYKINAPNTGERKLVCPGCGKFVGHDREYPPNPYYCDECSNV